MGQSTSSVKMNYQSAPVGMPVSAPVAMPQPKVAMAEPIAPMVNNTQRRNTANKSKGGRRKTKRNRRHKK